MGKLTYDFLKRHNLILYEVIVGSQAYGTAVENSDVDIKFVYIQPEDDILGMNYTPQLEVNKDFVGYEIKRFLELVEVNNPTILEMVYSPAETIRFIHPAFNHLLEKRDKFLTKQCKDRFGKYGYSQIKKAKGLNKMMNWEKHQITRKDPLDFCYVIQKDKTQPLKQWLKNFGYKQEFCGLVKIPNARDMYAVFYDMDADLLSLEDFKKDSKIFNHLKPYGYKGMVKINENGEVLSNELRLSSVPMYVEPVGLISYNKDGYIRHCKDYNLYQKWLKERNNQRWIDVKNHDQRIDGKNMLHCIRLINVAVDIAEGKGVIVKRPEAQYLLEIRKGKHDLNTLLNEAREKLQLLDELYEKSDLPEKIEDGLINDILVKIRKTIYRMDSH